MADAIDMANEVLTEGLDASVAAVRAAAAEIPAGEPGVCDDCGDDSPRLVEDRFGLRCAPCRDGRRR